MKKAWQIKMLLRRSYAHSTKR